MRFDFLRRLATSSPIPRTATIPINFHTSKSQKFCIFFSFVVSILLYLFSNNETTKNLKAIPISIPYQIDIYTRYQDEADEYARNIVYNIINYPKLDIIIPYYDENYTHHSNIRMQSDIEDTSDVPERLVPGQFTRMTIHIYIDDAYLFDINYSKTKRICPNSNVTLQDN